MIVFGRDYQEYCDRGVHVREVFDYQRLCLVEITRSTVIMACMYVKYLTVFGGDY